MPIVEYRSGRPGQRSRPKRLTIVPGLASLLADISRERLTSLAREWAVPDPDNPGTAAVLYRAMTSASNLETVFGGLGEAVRLVFSSLAARSGPVRRSTVGHLVPFSDEELDSLLARLQDVGLVWTILPPGRADDVAELWWLVPRDIARASRHPAVGRLSSPQPRDRELRETHVLPSQVTDLEPLTTDPGGVAELENASQVIDRLLSGEMLLAIMSQSNPERVRDVAHLAVCLRVLEANGRIMEPGLRSSAWTRLAEPERVRALTRIWSVDDTEIRTVPAEVRHGVLTALRLADPEKWYDANALARLVALHGTASAAGGDRTGRSIDRVSVDRALLALTVFGTLRVVIDRRERPIAVRLTSAGYGAIR